MTNPAAHPRDESLGVVGSPSSTSEVTVDIVGDAGQNELLGSMVTMEQPLRDERTQVALGTVTQVTTRNQWHENTSMRGVIAQHGSILSLSGRADVRGADVSIQAVYVKDQEDGYEPGSSTMYTSPTTGVPVHKVTNEMLSRITHASRSDRNPICYLGDIHSMPGVRLPLNPPDFAGARGASHVGVFGPSGAGKSVFASFHIANQLRHPDLGVFIIDPQGQFTSERGFTFSLQGLAQHLGRAVITKTLSTEVRLPQDRNLFVEMLQKTPFLKQGLQFRHGPATEAAYETFRDALERTAGWSEQPVEEILDGLLNTLRDATEAGDIYKDLKRDRSGEIKPEGAAWKLLEAISDAAAAGTLRRERLLRYLRPVSSLFSPTGPNGSPRTKMEAILNQALDRRPGQARPLVILNMQFVPGPQDDDDTVELIKTMDSEPTKARILRTLFNMVERVSSQRFQSGESLLNTMIVFDEAWRYAPKSTKDEEVAALSSRLAGYARETRKYGVGWMYTLQSPSTLHPDVWDQLKSGFRALGYGLTGSDLELVRAQVDKPESIALYRNFAQPSEQNRKYPFMVVGSISPLSFTAAPVYLNVFTSFDDWCEANAAWLPEGANALAKDPSAAGRRAAPERPRNDVPPPPEEDPFM